MISILGCQLINSDQDEYRLLLYFYLFIILCLFLCYYHDAIFWIITESDICLCSIL